VVGADLRNELRSGTAWGGSDPKLDWHAAAERGGNVVLDANPNLLVMVEGPQYSTDFTAFTGMPLMLKVQNRLVYSPHAYASASHNFASYNEMKQAYDTRAGFLLHNKPEVPLWIGEFGSCQTLDCGANSQWFIWFVQYLKEKNLSWGYWPLNGTQSSGYSRTYDTLETYGLLSTDYRHISAPKIVALFRTIQ
jgi:endoglucanase